MFVSLTLIFNLLKTFTFKSFVLFGKHTLLDKSIRVLQPPKHLSTLTENG